MPFYVIVLCRFGVSLEVVYAGMCGHCGTSVDSSALCRPGRAPTHAAGGAGRAVEQLIQRQLVASLLLVVRPGAPNSVLDPSSDALCS